jgi:hypothetical protein
MNAKKSKAIEAARILYCEVNEAGQKKYTLQEIAKIVGTKCKYATTLSTISRWAIKFDWEDTFIKLKQAGIEKAKGDIDNKIIDEKSDIIAEIYKNNKTILTLSKNHLFAKLTGQKVQDKDGNPIDVKMYTADLIRLMEHSEATLLNLHDKKSVQQTLDLSSMSTEELLTRLDAIKKIEK